MDQEKIKWMEEVGMMEFKEPIKYFCSLGGDARPHSMLYSAKYVEDTPLEELKEGYKKNFVAKQY